MNADLGEAAPSTTVAAPDGRPVILDVQGLAVVLGGDKVLDGVTLQLRQGEFVGVAGPNGGGKSTLLRCIVGLIDPAAGSIRIFGESGHTAAGRRRIAYLAQNEAHVDPLFPATALEVASLGRVARRGLFRALSLSDRTTALRCLEEVGVAGLKDRLVGSLSGGQRQRVLLAKALAGEPDLLLLDEPTTGIDPQARDEFHHLLAELSQRKGITVMLVSHDTDFLAHIAQRVILLDRRVYFDGDPAKQPDAIVHLHPGHPTGGTP